MKFLSAIALGATASTGILASVIPQQEPLSAASVHYNNEMFLIELGPYRTRWVTEEEKWALKLDGVNFIDITAEHKSGLYPKYQTAAINSVHFPEKTKHADEVVPLLHNLSKQNMQHNLEKFTSFYTRYYKSTTGIDSATWLYEQVSDIIQESGASRHGAFVEKFTHPWGQFSIIARIPGQSKKTVVLGAHQDSINLFLPSFLAAPGADDDGSGTVTLLESLRSLLQSDTIVQGNMTNTVEFHWYSAEEGGMLGSQAVFTQYNKDKKDVKAMLQQDMTGYIQGTLDAGRPESIGIMVDYVDQGLTQFLREVVTSYCDIPYADTKCGYACSDHSSAHRWGYPSAMATEAEMENTNKKIHTTEDKISNLSFDHMLQHAKLTLAFAYELAFAPF
ncbi:Leucine aminopeptidase 1 [Aspergillus wentii]|nr:Leucine aminopeptidase 1 [Aspergillus wentii]